MYLWIGSTRYDDLKSLSVVVEAGLDGLSSPASYFTADVRDAPLDCVGETAALFQRAREGTVRQWAMYSVTDAQAIGSGFTRITATSKVAMLDGVKLPARMLQDGEGNGTPIEDVLSEIRDAVGGTVWDFRLDETFAGLTLTGYAPRQTARERLTWVCLAANAWIKDFGTYGPTLTPLPDGTTRKIVPARKTFWRPKVASRSGITSVSQEAYTYERRDPVDGEHYIEVDSVKWVYYIHTVVVTHPSMGYNRAVEINDVTIKGGVVRGPARVLSIRAGEEIEMEAVNNFDFLPGEELRIQMDDGSIYRGFCVHCEFRFGLQSRAKMLLYGCRKE